jgi:hypothetical protein
MHEDVRVHGEPARLERAVEGFLELARLVLAPALRGGVRQAWDYVQAYWRRRHCGPRRGRARDNRPSSKECEAQTR